ncbi:hypothetical protein [Alkalimarinus coralli]|uniref:hypothetical protein n=1 Tax=Alkalimarinus coralli TaxID=2935863 RepID=UPI00202B8890|nr:hypothetical protein [Alkalimarinus coralli]
MSLQHASHLSDHRQHKGLALAAIFLLVNSTALNATDFFYSGYLKSYALWQDTIDIEQAPSNLSSQFQSQNAMRLMGSAYTETSGNVEVHYELQPVYYSEPQITNSSGISSTLSLGSNRYRYKDLDVKLKDDSDYIIVWQNLDRFNYQYGNEYGDTTIGRQVISFGSARFINPTDIFIPFTISTLNQEYRVGIDAIRYQADLGDFALLDTGLIIGENAESENSALFLRGKNSVEGNDIEGMFIKLDNAWLIGGGVERALGDYGFWFETAYMHLGNNSADSYWRSSIGTDYAVDDNVIVMLEYHYNGAGSNDPSNYVELLSAEPYQKAGIFLLGQHYLIPAISWIATPLVSVNANGFFNLSDQSVFINLSSEVSWSDNLYSDFGTYISYGDNLEYDALTQRPQFGSEFGAYPLSLYASLRYYF